MCVLVSRKKTLTYQTNNNKRDVPITTIFHCAVRITSMTIENDECVTSK